jgi:DNA-directed RNA polymerase specialized sigma24 family protein
MDDQTAVFVWNRDMLFAVAYHMLGSVTDTEDVLQEVWLAWSRGEPGARDERPGYLVRITTRQALRQLRVRVRQPDHRDLRRVQSRQAQPFRHRRDWIPGFHDTHLVTALGPADSWTNINTRA